MRSQSGVVPKSDARRLFPLMLGWQLAPGVGYCEVAGNFVFLDLVRDKYLSLVGADRAAFERLRAGEANDSETMGRLVGTGLLARANGQTRLPPTVTDIPGCDLSVVRDTPFSPAMALAAAIALRKARSGMRPGRIADTIERHRRRKSRIGVPGSEASVRRIATRFAAARWINPTPPRCLVDALALDHLLLSSGLSASLVFGVRLSPFAAHCWLQTPETVLTGTAAEARNFTPILVIA